MWVVRRTDGPLHICSYSNYRPYGTKLPSQHLPIAHRITQPLSKPDLPQFEQPYRPHLRCTRTKAAPPPSPSAPSTPSFRQARAPSSHRILRRPRTLQSAHLCTELRIRDERRDHGRRRQSPECEDSLESRRRLSLLNAYVRDDGNACVRSLTQRPPTDFWGPASNFGIPIAAVMDTQKDPDMYASLLAFPFQPPATSLTPLPASPAR